MEIMEKIETTQNGFNLFNLIKVHQGDVCENTIVNENYYLY